MHRVWQKLPWNTAPQSPNTKDVPCTIEGLASLLEAIKQAANAKDKEHLWEGLEEEEAFVEGVRRVSELLVWGETHDPRFLDLFCERRALADFVCLLTSDSAAPAVKVQLLQTFAIIVPNVQSASALHYLLDGNLVNGVIGADLDFGNEEILSWYISLLKSLALRLNRVTVRLFFDARHGAFPLFTSSMRFFSHSDLMVRSSVRCLMLSILCVEGDEVQSFLLEQVAAAFFRKVASSLCEAWLQIAVLIGAPDPLAGFEALRRLDDPACQPLEGDDSHTGEAMSDALHEETELLEYVHDIFSSVTGALSDVLVGCLLHGAVLPLLGALPARAPACAGPPGAGPPVLRAITPPVAVHALTGVARACGAHEKIVEPLAKALLSASISSELRDALLTRGKTADAIGTVTQAWQASQGSQTSLARWAASPDACSTLVENPFRSALVAFLGCADDGVLDDTASAGAPFAVKQLLGQLRAAPALPPRFQFEAARLCDGGSVAALAAETTTRLPAALTVETTTRLPTATGGHGAQPVDEDPAREMAASLQGIAAHPALRAGDASPGPDAPINVERQAVIRAQNQPYPCDHKSYRLAQVVLECVHAGGLVLEDVAAENRALLLRSEGDQLYALVGRQHQPQLFEALVRDQDKLMCISRTHFELSWSLSVGGLILKNVSANPLYVNGILHQTGSLVQVLSGATISFQSIADSTIFLTFRVQLDGNTKCVQPFLNDAVISSAINKYVAAVLATPATRPVLATLECTFAMGTNLQELPGHVRNVGMDLRHRTAIGRQHQPGFFENLLQGVPHFVCFISRAHVMMSCPRHAYNTVEVQNLSRNVIFVDNAPTLTGEVAFAHEGSVLAFTGESRPSHAEDAARFLQFALHYAAAS